MDSAVGVIILVIGIIVAIALHEVGHLLPAKLFGVRVPQYFIGFGPTLWSTTRGGTEYGVKAIPLGGFVRMAGMFPPAKAGARTHKNDGKLTMAEEVRRASAADLDGGPGRPFYELSAPKKLAVMFGGPVMNLIIAAVLAAVLMVGVGFPTLTASVGAVSTCVTGEETCDESEAAPAMSAGLQPGDRIISWGGQSVEDWPDVQRVIAEGGTGPTEVIIERDAVQETLTVTPMMTPRPVTNDAGEVVLNAAGEPQLEEKPFVGISPLIDLERQSITEVPGYIGDLLGRTAAIIVRLPQQLWNLTSDLITGEERDPTGVIGIVGVAQIAGQISGVESPEYTANQRAADLINLLIALNISLFVFNMIPLLPLDGGHIAGALYEGARRQIARVRGKPDPGPVDTAKLTPLSYAVAFAFIVMTVILIAADVFNPIELF